MATRADPFADADQSIDVSDFAQDSLKAKRKEVDHTDLASLARATGFDRSVELRTGALPLQSALPPDRSIKQRRYVTGRDTQLNLKCKAETKARFARLADAAKTSLGALFEQMVVTYEKTLADETLGGDTRQPGTNE